MGSSTQLSRSRNQYYEPQAHTATAGTISVVLPRGKPEAETEGEGIRYEQSYSVHHGDRWDLDESKVVEMSEFADQEKHGRTPVRVVARNAM